MTRRRRLLTWLGATVAVFIAVVMLAPRWFDGYVSTGVLQTETHQGKVLVALTDEPEVENLLWAGCEAHGVFPTSASDLLAARKLAQVPSGTKMRLISVSHYPYIGTMTIVEGRLKGRTVCAGRCQFTLLHAMP